MIKQYKLSVFEPYKNGYRYVIIGPKSITAWGAQSRAELMDKIDKALDRLNGALIKAPPKRIRK